ncbi:MAG: pseudoazurin [Salibaculum sp.]|jgi:pseudoazurin|uniref:pseudoazurin n=1 Tax=Roseovarius halophilus (ex Wu et al. 2025) TaxID=3376060 RepID=UPI0028706F2C|nr:pseudoazurin [Salibaculum sp.]MDR9426580.1 pseudoazurin [Salibaculum sp.]MDR9481241.1 pseudoazurin [Salibaculum sp.]
MKFTRRKTLALMSATAAGSMAGLSARAESHGGGTVHEVLMLNSHPDDRSERMVFVPDIVRAEPGDTIRFVSEDPGHNSQVNPDMMPEGGEEWRGRVNQDVEVTLETEGTYGYFCLPHRGLGMVGLVLVGDASVNFEEARQAQTRGQEKKRYDEIFARAEEMLAEENA